MFYYESIARPYCKGFINICQKEEKDLTNDVFVKDIQLNCLVKHKELFLE